MPPRERSPPTSSSGTNEQPDFALTLSHFSSASAAPTRCATGQPLAARLVAVTQAEQYNSAVQRCAIGVDCRLSDCVSASACPSVLPFVRCSLCSNAKREQVKKENPDIKFGDVGQSFNEQYNDQQGVRGCLAGSASDCFSAPFLFLCCLFSFFSLSFIFPSNSLAKKISEMWKAVSASEKTKFEKAAADDKKRHEKELADYKARGGGADDDEAPKRKSTNTCAHKHGDGQHVDPITRFARPNFSDGIAPLHPPTRTHLFLCSFVLVCRGCPGQEGCCR